MLFNLFGKKEEKDLQHSFTDLIFLSEKAKENAVVTFAKEHTDFIFISWFEDTCLHYQRLFIQQGLDEKRVEEARQYATAKYPDSQLAFLEHHLLNVKENALVQNCTQQSFTVFNSLTEPLFTYFGGERIIPLMQRMGFAENEAIQHKMISRSLQKAQKKIAKQMRFEQPGNSQEEWMRRNCKKD